MIFCHQEDSSWPLSEGAILKKRFDDMFDSTKYTKALDSFRKTEKMLLATAKEHKIDLAGLASHQHAAKGFRQELEEHSEVLESLEEEKTRIRKQLENVEKELAEYAEISSRVQELKQKATAANQKKLQKEAEIRALRSSLEEDKTKDYTIEELSKQLNEFDSFMSEHVEKEQHLKARMKSISDKIEKLRAEERQLSGKLGKYAAEKEQHEARLKERSVLMEKMDRAYSMEMTQGEGFDQSLSYMSATQTVVPTQDTVTFTSEDMDVFMQSLDKKVSAMEEEAADHKARSRAEEEKLNNALVELKGQLKSNESGVYSRSSVAV